MAGRLVADIVEVDLTLTGHCFGELVLSEELQPTDAPQADLVDVFKRLDDFKRSLPMVGLASMLGERGLKDDLIDNVTELDSSLHLRLELSEGGLDIRDALCSVSAGESELI